jgi:hypothetical protein
MGEILNPKIMAWFQARAISAQTVEYAGNSGSGTMGGGWSYACANISGRGLYFGRYNSVAN